MPVATQTCLRIRMLALHANPGDGYFEHRCSYSTEHTGVREYGLRSPANTNPVPVAAVRLINAG